MIMHSKNRKEINEVLETISNMQKKLKVDDEFSYIDGYLIGVKNALEWVLMERKSALMPIIKTQRPIITGKKSKI